MKEIATAAEVRECFIIENVDEAEKHLVKTIREQLDYDTCLELLASATIAEDQEKVNNRSMCDKMVGIVRQCFLMGFIDSFRKGAEAAKMSFDELFQVEK